MRDILPGLLLAIAASSCFNLAVVVQAGEARAVPPAREVRISLLLALVRRRRWRLGLALSAAAVPLQVVALTLAPLTVVQPADAAGLVVLLVAGARVLGEPARRRELLAVGAIVLGVAGVSAAGVAQSASHAAAGTLALVLAPLALAAAAPYLMRGRLTGTITVLAAGLAFALGAFALKLIADSLSARAWGEVAGWAAFAGLFAILGVNSEMTALQRRAVVAVAPVIFTIELAVPVILAPIAGGEPWPRDPWTITLIVGSLLVTIAGAVSLMRGGPVAEMLDAEHRACSGLPAPAA